MNIQDIDTEVLKKELERRQSQPGIWKVDPQYRSSKEKKAMELGETIMTVEQLENLLK